PIDMPKRPLSAYNLFFKARREAIMLAAEGVGFANLARTIATEWKILDAQERVPYETIAAVDKERY
ncbi:hypothetical protein FRACYDRAFT_155556, partial [Fragilariopsis cylindrus CCMP1102]